MSPPRLAERLLAIAVADPDWRAAILGDLSEEFSAMHVRDPRRARRWYWRQALGISLHYVRARLGRPAVTRPMIEQDSPRAGLGGLLWHDLRFAWRSVTHQPALSATIVLVLAVALAANAAIFTIGDALVLRPFRYPGVDRAVTIASAPYERFFARASVAAGDFLDWREQTRDVFESLAAIDWWEPTFTQHGAPQQLEGFKISPELFVILGEPPLLGRPLRTLDLEGPPVVVISETLWRGRLDGRPDVLGVRMRIDGVAHEIVGVMRDSFRAPFGADVWAPLVFPPEAREARERGYLIVVGALAPGVTIEQADARLQAILAHQKAAYPDTHTRREISVRTLIEGFGDAASGPIVAVWQVAAVLLLLVACANAANLVLARNTEREREFAIRLALGASRTRIAWQLLLEGLLLAGTAAAVAVPLAAGALQATRAALPPVVIRFVGGFDHVQLEPRTFLVTVALACGATMLFALAPAFRAGGQSVSSGLRHGGRPTAGPGRQRGRAVLATAQIALTLALLGAAGLSVSALYRVTDGPLGFDQHGVLASRLSLPASRYGEDAQQMAFVERVLTRLHTRPAVIDAGAISHLPYGGSSSSTSLWPEHVLPRAADATVAQWRAATAAALPLLKVRLIDGRMLSSADRADAPPVALVDRMLARRVWPDGSAVGQRFRVRADGPLITVVGVVDDVRHDWLLGAQPTLYRPFAQDPPLSFAVLLRTAGDPVDVTADLRAAVLAEDAEQPLLDARAMTQVVEDGTAGLRITGRALGIIALLSFFLSIVGLYSLMSFLTTRRTREIGVRVALGATRWDVIRLTGATALRLTMAGLAIGWVLSLAAGRALEGAMFGVVTSDVGLVSVMALALGAVAIAASYVPARRAATISPTIALRTE